MKLSWRTVLGLLHTFGGLLIFQAVLWRWGTKPAIAASLAYLLLDGIWRLAQREKLPAVWLLSNGLAVTFGIVDLWARTPFMIRYEGAISNVIVGLLFLAGASGERPKFMDLVEQGMGQPLPKGRPELVAFFRSFAILWAAYSFAKAGIILWLVQAYPLPQALALRSLIGTATLIPMLALSFGGRRVFGLCQRIGLFRPKAAPDPAPEPTPERAP
jgi:intracellular septation protein A